MYSLGRRNGEAFPRLSLASRVQIPTGTKLHNQARIMRRVKVSVKSRQKRMVKHPQNIPLRLGSPELLPYRQRFPVHHLHRVQPTRRPADLTEVDVSEVAAAEAAEEPEVVETHFSGGKASHGFPGGVVGVVGLERGGEGRTRRRRRD